MWLRRCSMRPHPHAIVRPRLRAALAWVLLTLLAGFARGDARPPDPLGSAELRLALRRLTVLGSVLFVAAHPDDENTALLTYLTHERLARVGYLSLTRGDGGQNLIGSETGEQLGLIRTQELLAARRVDGAEQFFTRAVDFGYSKSPDETLEIWGKDEVLADVVRVIREFRPDVIITRFPTDGGGGHGHHTASALLAEEAFEAAADPTRYPEQLSRLAPWRAARVLWNAWRPQLEGRDPALPPLLSVDLGTYNPLLGRSYSEIAAASRSMHKSQGFGSAERRGTLSNYLEHRAGTAATTDLFEGVNLGWSRLPEGARVERLIRDAERRYLPERPETIVAPLVEVLAALRAMPDGPWLLHKRRELLKVIRSAAGLWIEAIAASPSASPGEEIEVAFSVLNRSGAPLTLEAIELPFGAVASAAVGGASEGGPVRDRSLEPNRPVEASATIRLPADLEYTQPYWLREEPRQGLFQVSDPDRIGSAESPPALSARVVLRSGGERLGFDAPVLYRWTDRVDGERYRPFAVVPPVTLRLDQGVYVFPERAPKRVRVVARSARAPVRGMVRLAVPAGWSVVPDEVPIDLAGSEDETPVVFTVTPGAERFAGVLRASVETTGRSFSYQRVVIDHSHIPIQTLFPPAEARLVRADILRAGQRIGYVMGSGDQVPEALEQVGYRVTRLEDADLESADLKAYDAIVIGVRAFNTRVRLVAQTARLWEYVERGGTVVVQYQTSDRALNDRLGPYPFTLSRDRVTMENAPVRFLVPDHPLLQRPNRITATDFEGWVQERGLYFANPWDPKYQTVLSANDPGESPKDGGLLYARHGKGTYIYSGYAWFRELPAGVPGAYRLFVNLVSAGK